MFRIHSFSKKIRRLAALSLAVALAVQPALAAAPDEAAVDSILAEARRGGAPVQNAPSLSRAAESRGGRPATAGPPVEPPPGASHQPELTPRIVKRQKHRVRRDEVRPQPPARPFASNSPDPDAPARDWRELRFVGGSAPPRFGVDPALRGSVASLRGKGRSATYGFLRMDEYLGEETRGELESLGIEVLGAHGSAYKVRLPLDETVLDEALALPYVEWIGRAPAELKVDPALRGSTGGDAADPRGLPVVVNLFDDDSDGSVAEALEEQGLSVGAYDADLRAYRAVAPPQALDAVAALDTVLYVERVRTGHTFHDQSMAAMGVDYIRPGALYTGGFDGSSVGLGIMDSGFDVAAGGHVDLRKSVCGKDYILEPGLDVFDDGAGHGTHVLGTISGTGTADPSKRGVAIGVGSQQTIRGAKIFDSNGIGNGSIAAAMDWLGLNPYFYPDEVCASWMPLVVNLSGGFDGVDSSNNPQNFVGTDAESRKLDQKVFDLRQLYVVSAGNNGPQLGTIGRPGVAKNALTVGNAWDATSPVSPGIGEIRASSSRGPTGDGRMKPNVMAPGTYVTSAAAGTVDGYIHKRGTSMAAPHVTGLAATLMDHYPYFKGNPHMVRAAMMATAILHGDSTFPSSHTNGGRSNYGMGHVSAYITHWGKPDPAGWEHRRLAGTVTDADSLEVDVQVPSGAERLVVVATWDEPAASAGAAQAVTYDLDLVVDEGADCAPALSFGYCGEYLSWSTVDNVEYLIIEAPTPGTTRLKVMPWNGRPEGLPVALSYVVLRGDPRPQIELETTADVSGIMVGDTFTVTTTVTNPEYVAMGATVRINDLPAGLELVDVTTTRKDGTVASPVVELSPSPLSIPAEFGEQDTLTLGNIVGGDSRSAVWTFRVTTGDPGSFYTLNFVAEVHNSPASSLSAEVVDVVECYSSFGCSDGLYCNGVEACFLGRCISGAAPDCGPGGSCDESANQCVNDSDGDGVTDDTDNCLEAQNPTQVDSDGDGYGNACDADYDNDGLVDVSDFIRFSNAYGAMLGDPKYDPDLDSSGDGLIANTEFILVSGQYGGPPGPSGLSCAGAIPCSAP